SEDQMTGERNRPMRTLAPVTILLLIASPSVAASYDVAVEGDVTCEGTYPHHLQGICADDEAIYWSFTTTLVKTNLDGDLLKSVPVANHHGDLCHHDGKLYVAVNLGKFNDPQGNADSWVY